MEASRQALTFLLAIAMMVAPVQGAMAGQSKMSDAPAEHATLNAPQATPAKQSAPVGAHAHCSQQPDHNTANSGTKEKIKSSGFDGALQAKSMTPLCDCSGNCKCCGKVLAPAIPSLYTTVRISSQTERAQTFSHFTGTFVLVKTRPPTGKSPA